MQNVGEISATVAINFITKKLGTYGFAIQAGMAIGNMIFNTSGLCLGTLDTIVYGDMATSMAKILSDAIYRDTDDYYNIGGEQEQRLQIVSQLRVMGEDSFMQLFDTNTSIVQGVYELQGYSREDLKKDTISRISKVMKICKKIFVDINDEYGLYVYEN